MKNPSIDESPTEDLVDLILKQHENILPTGLSEDKDEFFDFTQ